MKDDKTTYGPPPDDMRQFSKRDSIASWDLEGRDRIVRITRVLTAYLPARQGRAADKTGCVFFCGAGGKEHPKPLLLNATNRETLTKLYGKSGKGGANWVGKLFAMYPTTTRFGAETVDCVRIRPVEPKDGKKLDEVSENVAPNEAMMAKQDAAAEAAERGSAREPGED